MAARILLSEVEEEKEGTVRTRDNNSDRNEGDTPREHAADRAQAARGGPDQETAQVRDRDDRRDARSHHAAPQVEDQTIVELRQDFSAGRDSDGMDMGI